MKPSTAKAKGRETENLFVQYLIENGVPYAERRRLNGTKDEGDVTGWPGVCVEIKSGATLSVPKWLSELETEMVNSRATTGFVAVRPKGKPDPQDWFGILPMPVLIDLMKDAGWITNDVE